MQKGEGRAPGGGRQGWATRDLGQTGEGLLSPPFLPSLQSLSSLKLPWPSLALLWPAVNLGRGEGGGETPQTAKHFTLKRREFYFQV